MLAAFLLMLASSVILKDKKSAKKVFWGVIISSVVLFLFQTFRFFLPSVFSLGILADKTDNLLGSWNAFGLFTGFSVVISLFILEFFQTSKLIKWLLGLLILFSILLAAAVNFPLVWEMLGVFALIIFVYKVSLSFSKKGVEGEKRYFPIFSFVVVLISLLFFMSSQFMGGLLPSLLGLSNTEVGPSFMTTMSVTGQSLVKNPVLGVGPNKFGQVWAMFKPQAINNTQFWDTSFNSGSGLLPTFASTTGLLGIVAWILFFVLFVITGFRYLFFSIKNNVSWEVMIFFVASLYLFIASFFYSTGEVIFFLAFAFTGVFIGLSSSSSSEGEIHISLLEDPRRSFFSVLIMVILMIISAAAGFKYVERMASVSYFGNAFLASNIDSAETSVAKAVSLYPNDLYLRTYTQVYLTKINNLIAKGSSSLTDADKTELQTDIGQMINSAQAAVNFDDSNYLNYNSLGVTYNTAGMLGVKDAYDKALEAYNKSTELNPLNPGIKLSIARIYLAAGKIKEARDSAQAALNLKADYIEALITLSQVEKADGNNSTAINYAESALSFAPNNKDLIQYVNSLKSGGSAQAPSVSTPTESQTPSLPSTKSNTKTKK